MNEKTFVGYYVSWLVQFLGGSNYLILFAVVLTMEIALCTFIGICFDDLEQICKKVNENDLGNDERSRERLKEGIQLHVKIME